jgi:hypothetical protein
VTPRTVYIDELAFRAGVTLARVSTGDRLAMAIYRMIRESVFEPEAIERMTVAYENALKALQITDPQDPKTELIARKIIECAGAGETDPERLCQRALKALGKERKD